MEMGKELSEFVDLRGKGVSLWGGDDEIGQSIV